MEGTHNFIANDIITHNTNEYIQYLASFNTSLTSKLLNITINYSGISTDSFGNYNHTLKKDIYIVDTI
ncbi:hypothetical protein CMO93_03130 [Candidatus Woesearchaeota archaeon]|nr:hypothetical protein [Candidatus Woesearchaeota archaeon]